MAEDIFGGSRDGGNQGGSGPENSDEGEDALRTKLAQLRQQHRDLDAAIEALELSGAADPLRIRRLKKMKLCIRDEIGFIEDQLIPDIIA
jgi:hypothetical protein